MSTTSCPRSIADNVQSNNVGLLSNDTGAVAAEATATHVLLGFHMLFINILLLNLLIAVFTYVALDN